MAGKHTSGPWTAWKMSGAGWQIGTKAQVERKVAAGKGLGYGNIASIMFYQCRPLSNGGPYISDEMEEADIADAHLIAAAPDMYEALEAALRYDEAIQRYASKGQSWVEGDDLDALYDDWITKSRSALRRARGEE